MTERTLLVEMPASDFPMTVARTKAAKDVLAERQRQLEKEGWTPDHDDEHDRGEMALAAAAYAVASTEGRAGYLEAASKLFHHTGWAKEWWKPKSCRADLVRAGALILAEIERLDRADGIGVGLGRSQPETGKPPMKGIETGGAKE